MAIDENGVWSWIQGGHRPENPPLVAPTDEDAKLAAEKRAELEDTISQRPRQRLKPFRRRNRRNQDRGPSRLHLGARNSL